MPSLSSPLLDQYDRDGVITPGLQNALDIARRKLGQQFQMPAPMSASAAPAPTGPPSPGGLVGTPPAPTPTLAPPGPPVPTITRPVATPTLTTPSMAPAPDPAAAAHQAERNRLISTGSGISQIKNPFVRTLARIGDIAGSAFFPGITAGIPGTELHHNVLVRRAENTVNQDVNREHAEAQTEQSRAAADASAAQAEKALRPHIPTSELEAYLTENPNGTMRDFLSLKREFAPERAETPFSVWRKQNPEAPAEDWLKTEEGAKYRPPNEYADFRTGYLQAHPDATPDQLVTEFTKAKQAPRQPVPGVDVPYSKDVEEQRRRLNAARAALPNGLTSGQMSLAEGLATKLDAHPQVKDYNVQVNKYQTVKGLLDRPLGGPGDLAIVYEFMKALDPTSVVRESEYASASKSGNIFAGALARFNGYLKPEGGFLPPEVKAAFGRITQQKMDVSQQQVRAITDDYARRIDEITGQPGTGRRYITSYAGLYDQSFGGGSQIPTVTTKAEYDALPSGAVYMEDGKKYKKP